jgi:hypothetical protein
MCARGIECASFEDFPVGWWNCSDGMTFFFSLKSYRENNWSHMCKLKCIYGIINVFFNRKRRYFNNPIRWFGLVWWYLTPISAISWRSLLMVEEPVVHGPVASHWQTFHIMLCRPSEIRTHNVSDDRCKSNYHTITTTTASSKPLERQTI